MNHFRNFVFMLLNVFYFFVALFFWVPFAVALKPLRDVFTGPVGWCYRYLIFPLIGVKVKVIGEENVPKDKAFVVLSNHQSYLDIGLIIGWVRPTVFFAKIELFKVPLFGQAIKIGRCIPIHRGHPRRNKHVAAEMNKNINLGSCYCIFPEGTRSTKKEVLKFKSGIFKYIQDEPVPVLPVTLRNAGEIMPKKKGMLKSGTIEIVIHPLLQENDYAGCPVDEFRENVRSTIKSGLTKDFD